MCSEQYVVFLNYLPQTQHFDYTHLLRLPSSKLPTLPSLTTSTMQSRACSYSRCFWGSRQRCTSRVAITAKSVIMLMDGLLQIHQTTKEYSSRHTCMPLLRRIFLLSLFQRISLAFLRSTLVPGRRQKWSSQVSCLLSLYSCFSSISVSLCMCWEERESSFSLSSPERISRTIFSQLIGGVLTGDSLSVGRRVSVLSSSQLDTSTLSFWSLMTWYLMFWQQKMSPMCMRKGLGYCTEVKLVWERQTTEKGTSCSFHFSLLYSIIITCLRDTYLLFMGMSLSKEEPTNITGLVCTSLQTVSYFILQPLACIFQEVLLVVRERRRVCDVLKASSSLLCWVYSHSLSMRDGSLSLKNSSQQFMIVMQYFLSGSQSSLRKELLYLLRKEREGKSCLAIEWKYWMKVSTCTMYSPLNCLYQHRIVIYEYFTDSPFFFDSRPLFIQ